MPGFSRESSLLQPPPPALTNWGFREYGVNITPFDPACFLPFALEYVLLFSLVGCKRNLSLPGVPMTL